MAVIIRRILELMAKELVTKLTDTLKAQPVCEELVY